MKAKQCLEEIHITHITIYEESKNMFELIGMSLLGVAYIHACKEEAAEEKRQKEEERICDLKISVFCYAARHHLKYNDVVKMI